MMLKIAKINLFLLWVVFTLKILIVQQVEPCLDCFAYYDKIVHFFLFAIFSFLLFIVLSSFRIKKIAIGFYVVLVSFLYGALIEYWQITIPGRFFSYQDMLFNLLGALITICIVLFFKRKPKLLLHICCAGCGAYVSQVLKKDFRVVLYYDNSNIDPEKEHKKRLREIKKVAKNFKLKLKIGEYNHKKWLRSVKGHEKDLEKGERCFICYETRMRNTVITADKNNFEYFTTTLSVSPHKIYKKISEIGKKLENEYGIKFFDKDFKKQDGFKLAGKISKKLGLYRQNYCGCEFSHTKNK